MKYKTLFRLLLKMAGIWIIIEGFSSLLGSAAGLVSSLFRDPQLRSVWLQGYLANMVQPALQIGLGAYLFFAGGWVVNKAIPGNRPYCPECGYDLTGVTANRCPECERRSDLRTCNLRTRSYPRTRTDLLSRAQRNHKGTKTQRTAEWRVENGERLRALAGTCRTRLDPSPLSTSSLCLCGSITFLILI